MKVFISWSGQRSKDLAAALKDWLPMILQYVNPWMSEKDITAGERWAQSVAVELEASNFGILCVTPENINSPWLLFEAGALSKSMIEAKVIPLLYGVELRDLSGPLAQFQARKVDQDGMLAVIKAINSVSDNKVKDTVFESSLPALWTLLQKRIENIPQPSKHGNKTRSQGDVLEELVTQVRGLTIRVRDFNLEKAKQNEGGYSRIKNYEDDKNMINSIYNLIRAYEGSGFSLLVMAGLIRDRMPWLAEVLCEASREMKSSSFRRATETYEQLIQTSRQVVLEWSVGRDFLRGIADDNDGLFAEKLLLLIEEAAKGDLHARTKNAS